jgi:hypothetical protein
MRPPIAARLSKTVTRAPESARRQPAVRPAAPPPTTATRALSVTKLPSGHGMCLAPVRLLPSAEHRLGRHRPRAPLRRPYWIHRDTASSRPPEQRYGPPLRRAAAQPSVLSDARQNPRHPREAPRGLLCGHPAQGTRQARIEKQRRIPGDPPLHSMLIELACRPTSPPLPCIHPLPSTSVTHPM